MHQMSVHPTTFKNITDSKAQIISNTITGGNFNTPLTQIGHPVNKLTKKPQN
jgi:hypothetical protein